MPWLLDTNVLSELRRTKPEPRVADFIAATPLKELFTTSVSFAEIRFGITKTKLEQRALLTNWLDHKVRPMFTGRVLQVTEDIMYEWRLMVEEGRRVGHTFSQPDLLIAAVARKHGLIVVTRNRKDFEKARVNILNQWGSN